MKKDIICTNQFMKVAIGEAYKGIRAGHGGPFGCVIVKDGEIIGRGHNQVLSRHDPTLHGEVAAIRNACRKLKTHDLTGCELYTTGEPCPMCLYACLWANIEKVYYGCTIEDNGMLGFRDAAFDQMGTNRKRLKGYLSCMDREACLELFAAYQGMEHQSY